MMGQMLLRQAKKPWLSRLLLLKFDAPYMKILYNSKSKKG